MHDGRWKLLVCADGTGAEPYDLAAEQPEVAGRLRAAVLSWLQSVP